MKALRAFLLDDEDAGLGSLAYELEAFVRDIEIVGSSRSPIEAISMVESLQPDVVFLDIEMPEMNGFEWLAAQKVIPYEVIFTTAYDQFALKAFEADAADYLMKPVGEEALKRSIERIKERRRDVDSTRSLNHLVEQLQREVPGFRKVGLPTLQGLLFLRPEDIVRCSAESNYTHIITANGEKFLISRTLKEIEHLLDERRFIRVHHSHLINLLFIREYHKGKGGSIILDNGDIVPVAKQRRQDLLDRL